MENEKLWGRLNVLVRLTISRYLTWNSTMLMNNDKVCHLIRSAGTDNVFHHIVSAVDSLRIGKDKSHFFCKLLQPTAWVSTCGYKNFGIENSSARIFVVLMGRGFCWGVSYETDAIGHLSLPFCASSNGNDSPSSFAWSWYSVGTALPAVKIWTLVHADGRCLPASASFIFCFRS